MNDSKLSEAQDVGPLAGLDVNDSMPMAPMARALSKSKLVPESYRGDPSSILIAIDVAQRIGASPFAVLQNLDIIHGRPSWRAAFLIATVNASGRFTPLRFRFQGEEGSDDWGCRAYATDRESNEECLGSLVSIKIAKAEKWYSRTGSKWQTIPEQMLMYRSAAFWQRVYCPELSLGIHTDDEVRDIQPLNTIDRQTRGLADKPLLERLKSRSTPEPQEEPAPPDAPEDKPADPVEPEPTPEPVSNEHDWIGELPKGDKSTKTSIGGLQFDKLKKAALNDPPVIFADAVCRSHGVKNLGELTSDQAGAILTDLG